MRRTIYISGRVSGTSDARERFRRVEQRLRLQGWRVINPVRKTAHMNPAVTLWTEYMRVCLRLLTRCDAIYLMRGWRQSKGATVEQRLAVDLDLDIVMEEQGQ